MLLILTILFPAVAGTAASLLHLPRKTRRALYLAVILVTDALGAAAAFVGGQITLFPLTSNIRFALAVDDVGRLFLLLVLLLYSAGSIYAFEYLEDDTRWNSFFIYIFTSFGGMLAVCLAKNLVSLYLCFEVATLTSMPLVLHDRTKESTAAALKYLFYSIGGAFLGLLAVIVLSVHGVDAFVPGGSLPKSEYSELVRAAVFLGIVGFGTKAGIYPMHGWLPTAHPVAPAPASALLSGIIVKAGILAVIRLVYFSAGPELLRGTWAQTAWMCLALLTVFMGSMLAWREKVLKKRLAYSTVSQLSYIMLGLSLLCDAGLRGALLHTMAHAPAKGALFLCAGAFIHRLGKREVGELRGIGKRMPATVWCFLLAGLSLVGIPPMGGFVSKWQIASSALEFAPGPFAVLIPCMLLLSALLTAGYLLAPVVDAFFPAEDEESAGAGGKADPKGWMLVPLALLCCATLAVGLFANQLV